MAFSSEILKDLIRSDKGFIARRGGLIVSALNAGSRGLDSSPGRRHCTVFLDKTQKRIQKKHRWTKLGKINCLIRMSSLSKLLVTGQQQNMVQFE